MIKTEDQTVLSETTSYERCSLDLQERADKGKHLADALDILTKRKELHAMQKKAMREVEEALQDSVSLLQEDVETATELRHVDCEWVAIWPIGEAHLIRKDTQEVVKVREITNDERQLKIVPLTPVPKPIKRNPTHPIDGSSGVQELDDDLPPVA